MPYNPREVRGSDTLLPDTHCPSPHQDSIYSELDADLHRIPQSGRIRTHREARLQSLRHEERNEMCQSVNNRVGRRRYKTVVYELCTPQMRPQILYDVQSRGINSSRTRHDILVIHSNRSVHKLHAGMVPGHIRVPHPTSLG